MTPFQGLITENNSGYIIFTPSGLSHLKLKIQSTVTINIATVIPKGCKNNSMDRYPAKKNPERMIELS